jgi:hypothetical protein
LLQKKNKQAPLGEDDELPFARLVQTSRRHKPI